MGIKILDVAYVRFSAPDLFPALLERGHREMLSDTYAAEPVENRSLIKFWNDLHHLMDH